MDIFKFVSDTISTFFKKHDKADPIDKQDILNRVDNNTILLRLVVETYEKNTSLLKFVQTDLLNANGVDKNNIELRKIYTTYFTSLNHIARQHESTNLLESLYQAAKLVLADNQAILDNFDLLFKNGTDVGDITLEQIKLSHAVVFGFINLSELLSDWFCYFIGQITGQPDNSYRVPPYRMDVVRESSTTVSDFVNDVLLRGTSNNIISLVQSVKKAGDVAIYTESASLNSYASINDYPGTARYIKQFGSFQPILMIREMFSNATRDKYKRNVIMRDWIQAKIIILQMDRDKMDPESREYQQQVRVLKKYSDVLAKLDQKISQYEKSF